MVELWPRQPPEADHVCLVMSFARLLFAVVPGLLPVVSAVGRTPSAQDLVDEITDSRTIPGKGEEASGVGQGTPEDPC